MNGVLVDVVVDKSIDEDKDGVDNKDEDDANGDGFVDNKDEDDDNGDEVVDNKDEEDANGVGVHDKDDDDEDFSLNLLGVV